MNQFILSAQIASGILFSGLACCIVYWISDFTTTWNKNRKWKKYEKRKSEFEKLNRIIFLLETLVEHTRKYEK